MTETGQNKKEKDNVRFHTALPFLSRLASPALSDEATGWPKEYAYYTQKINVCPFSSPNTQHNIYLQSVCGTSFFSREKFSIVAYTLTWWQKQKKGGNISKIFAVNRPMLTGCAGRISCNPT
jgi:hypothetical protein